MKPRHRHNRLARRSVVPLLSLGVAAVVATNNQPGLAQGISMSRFPSDATFDRNCGPWKESEYEGKRIRERSCRTVTSETIIDEKRFSVLSFLRDTYRIEGFEPEITYYRLLGYDCISKNAATRLVVTKVAKPAETSPYLKYADEKWGSFKEVTRKNQQIFDMRCPTKAGYKRFGSIQVDLNSAMRTQDVVNLRTINSNLEGVLTLDCRRLLFGFNQPPVNPIVPNSIGSEIYSAVCK